MYLISELSKMTKISKRMLRYYEKLGLFTPYEVDERTNYRYYSDNDILKLEKISFLRNLGFSFPEVKQLLAYPENELIVEIRNKQEFLKREIKDRENEITKADIYIENMQAVKNEQNHFFKIKNLAPTSVITYKNKVRNYQDEDELWLTLNNFIEENKIEINHTNRFSIVERNKKEIEVCVEVLPKNALELIPTTETIKMKHLTNTNLIACKSVYGSLDNIEEAYCDFLRWLQNNERYSMTGKSRHVYELGPHNETNTDNYVVELQFEITA
ncbi:hypothetical protein BAU15_12925 [Enterococcus sp. JM4C]|uniref:MerR family transcriptional regulator n=1 Tax=Candidatus Enterococcus huntleyi TaxID=1857217 RepID=UPI00137A95DF|nr:MerR family transcriptional regulator [Enterococcus sp. JM4C]KAF1297664.1 hypothetical protein BAU15_12925 [Enterococcus sp. JM4C]